jgi:hypothetical protein
VDVRSRKIWATSEIFEKLPEANNRSTCGKSPNLVTLVSGFFWLVLLSLCLLCLPLFRLTLLSSEAGLPDGMYTFRPKIPIWVYFGGLRMENVGKFSGRFKISQGHLVNFTAIWYIPPRFGICIVRRKIWQPCNKGTFFLQWKKLASVVQLNDVKRSGVALWLLMGKLSLVWIH